MPRRRVVRRAGPKRKLIWARTYAQLGVTAGTTSVTDLTTTIQADLSADLIGVTIRRVILHFQARIATAQTTGTFGDGIQYALLKYGQAQGAAVATDGINSVQNRHLDWNIVGRFGPRDTVPVVGTQFDHMFDLRTGRKMDEVSESYFLFMDTEPQDGELYNVTLQAHLLLALS